MRLSETTRRDYILCVTTSRKMLPNHLICNIGQSMDVLIWIQKLNFIISKIYFIEYKYPMFIFDFPNFVSEKSSISFRMGLVSTVLTLRLAIIGLALVLMVFAFGIENNGFWLHEARLGGYKIQLSLFRCWETLNLPFSFCPFACLFFCPSQI